MSLPTTEQRENALAIAQQLRDQGQDTDFLGQTLLYLDQRNRVLENLRTATEHFLHSGEDQHAHARLIQALEATRHQPSDHHDSGAFGLE